MDPLEQGVDAAADGLPASANPYPEGTSDHARWNEGYHSVVDNPDDMIVADDTG